MTSGSESIVVGVDTMIFDGKAVSLLSDAGALAVMHGALQSAIGTVTEALKAETAYLDARTSIGSR